MTGKHKPTGCCPVCHHRYRLRKDGTLGAHKQNWRPCEGVSQLPDSVAVRLRRLQEAKQS